MFSIRKATWSSAVPAAALSRCCHSLSWLSLRFLPVGWGQEMRVGGVRQEVDGTGVMHECWGNLLYRSHATIISSRVCWRGSKNCWQSQACAHSADERKQRLKCCRRRPCSAWRRHAASTQVAPHLQLSCCCLIICSPLGIQHTPLPTLARPSTSTQPGTSRSPARASTHLPECWQRCLGPRRSAPLWARQGPACRSGAWPWQCVPAAAAHRMSACAGKPRLVVVVE